MRRRERTALAFTPLFLRLALAVTFLWAGLGKLLADVDVTRDQAIVLAAAGVRMPDHILPQPADKPTLDAPLEDPAPDTNADTASDSTDATDATDDDQNAESDAPEPAPATDDAPPKNENPSKSPSENQSESQGDDQSEEQPAAPAPPEGLGQPMTLADTAVFTLASLTQPDQGDAQAQDQADAEGAADAPARDADADVVQVRRVNSLILLMDKAANPDPREADGHLPPPIWPRALTVGARPKWLAWAATFTEIFAGFFLLIGLLTRLSALSLATVMGVAIWLTTIGPAIQSGDALLGFLPNYPAWSPQWSNPLLQFLVFMSAMALLFAGPGALALDRAIFAPSSSRNDDWDDDDAPAVRTSSRDRTPFDRTP